MKRALSLTVALTLIASSLCVCVVAGAGAVFAFARPWIGQAGAAALVSALFALFALGVAAARGGFFLRRPAPPEPATLSDRLFEMARERPIAAAGMAIAAGAVLAVRNPAVIGTIIRGLFEGRAGGRSPRY